MKRALILALILGFVSLATAMAQDSSPYVVGHWNLGDSFQDFTGGSAIATDNTDFTFLNPTDLTLTLEYAFFAEDPLHHPRAQYFVAVIATLCRPMGELGTRC
jgi:hypothetical protein